MVLKKHTISIHLYPMRKKLESDEREGMGVRSYESMENVKYGK